MNEAKNSEAHFPLSPDHPELSAFPVRLEIPVSFGDMDAYGHVNNTRYFRWFEDVRFSAFRVVGLTAYHEEHGIGPILASTNCVFRAPVLYPDTIFAGVRVSEIGEDRFTMRHRLVSQQQSAVVAEGDARIVLIDYRQGGKAPIPPEVRSQLDQIS